MMNDDDGFDDFVGPDPESRLSEDDKTAILQREEDKKQYRIMKARQKAERELDAETFREDSRKPDVTDMYQMIRRPQVETPWRVEGLLPVNGRMILGAFRKSGKTIVSLNLAISLVSGDSFLGMPVHCISPGRKVTWTNNELSAEMAQRWLTDMSTWVEDENALRIGVINLRGSLTNMLPTKRDGRAQLVETLKDLKTGIWIIDPIGPMMAAAGLDVSSERDAGEFLASCNQIAEQADISEIIYIAHVGKAGVKDVGIETVMGASRWEASVDSIAIMGKEVESGARWFRAEGRDVSIEEQTIVYDEITRKLRLVSGNREDRAIEKLAQLIAEIVRESPGINKSTLSGDSRVRGTKGRRLSAIRFAEDVGLVRTVRNGSSITYYAQ